MRSTEGDETLAPPDGHDYSRLRTDLVRAVSRLCPSWLAAQRDDLVQAAVMRVMAVRRQSEGKGALSSSYLYRVAHSALVDEIRRTRRRREVTLEDASGAAEVPGPGASPEREAAAAEIGRAIGDCLGTMKEERRIAVALSLQGHSVPDAARLLDWSHKRTENLVYRGMADLRDCLAARGHAP